MRSVGVVLVLAAGLVVLAAAEPETPPHPLGYVCARTEQPVKIDGRLDDAAWRDAPWTPLFIDIEGERRPRPRFATRAKMAWDERYFYIAAHLEEPHVWGTLTKHDSVIFHDNDFEVFIDPDGDTHNYFEFEMNALNTGWDLFLPKPYKDGGKADNSWEIPGLLTAVHVEGTLNDPSDRDSGWSLEIAFPWEAFRRPRPLQGERWRVNFSRVEWQHELTPAGGYRRVPGTKEDNWVWSPQFVIDMHRPERWGYVEFAEAGARRQFMPDAAHAAKERLLRLYYLQRDYRKANGRYARSLVELGLERGPQSPTMKTTKEGYEATLGGWHINQESLLRRAPLRLTD